MQATFRYSYVLHAFLSMLESEFMYPSFRILFYLSLRVCHQNAL